MDTPEKNIRPDDNQEGHVDKDGIQPENDNSARNDSTDDEGSTGDNQDLTPLQKLMKEQGCESEDDLVKKVKNQNKKISEQGQALSKFKEAKENLNKLGDDPDVGENAKKLGEALEPVTRAQEQIEAKSKDEAAFDKYVEENKVSPEVQRLMKVKGKHINLPWSAIHEESQTLYDITTGRNTGDAEDEDDKLRAGTGSGSTGLGMGKKPLTENEKIERDLDGDLPPAFK